MTYPPAFWLALATTAAVAWIGGALAVRWGWVDRRSGIQSLRKPRVAPVPLTGGTALFLGLVVASIWGGAPPRPWIALAAALVLGLVDDLREEGLSVRAKLVGQTLAALALALDPSVAAAFEAWPRCQVFVIAMLAQNAINTYDNTDGAATSLALVGLFPSPAARGALTSFLFFNLYPSGKGPDRPPLAYLGDSGSHLLGIWIASEPSAWPILLLPLLDLARLAPLRIARGRAPWQADRSHLAHRMLAAGWPASRVALGLAALASLPWMGVQGPVWWGVLGTLLCVAGFGILIAVTPDPEATEVPDL